MKTSGASKRIKRFFESRSFAFYDYALLLLLVFAFLITWFAVTRGSNLFVSGTFYSQGFKAHYEVEGVTAESLGTREISLEVKEAGEETATLLVEAGPGSSTLVVDRESAEVIEDTQTGMPLIFYYDAVREPGQVSATFEDEKEPRFSSEFTGLQGEINARIKPDNPDNVVVFYHRSPDRSYGPQFSWELPLYDVEGRQVGTIVNDITSGLLLEARFYQDGLGTINLTRTDYPTGLNRWAVFYALNSILLLWGVYHLLRARSHPDQWKRHWSYFPLNFVGISRFFIRILALTVFDFMGIGILTGNLTILFISDVVGLLLMIYAVGPFAFPVLFKFIPWVAALGVFAGGRPMDYVQYPFGVPLYFTSVVCYLLYRYLSYRKDRKLEAGSSPTEAWPL